MTGIRESIQQARTNNESIRQQRHAQADANQAAANKATDKKTSTRKKKLDDSTAKVNKGIDRAAQIAKQAGTGTAKRINSAFESAKVDTTRTGNYNQMSNTEILKDMAQDGVGTVYNGAVEVARQGAKGAYKAGKFVKDTAADAAAGVAKLANEADTAVKKVSREARGMAAKARNAVEAGADKLIADVKAEVKDTALGALGWASRKLGLD